MSIILRRTRAASATSDAELGQTIDVEALHALLHQRGEIDLATALLLRLEPESAHNLAAHLIQFRRRYSKPSLFRSYRRLLDVEAARTIDLAVAFLQGAGRAGCRVYLDPTTFSSPTALTRPRLVPQATDTTGEDQHLQAAVADDVTSKVTIPQAMMPPWLPKPASSVWNR